jgi:hypothetical protein
VCTRLAVASDKVYQLFAHGRWLSPGTPDSYTVKTGRHDIAEILLKVAHVKHNKSNQIKSNQIKSNVNKNVTWFDSIHDHVSEVPDLIKILQTRIMKEHLYSDGQQFYQYQQNDQLRRLS